MSRNFACPERSRRTPCPPCPSVPAVLVPGPLSLVPASRDGAHSPTTRTRAYWPSCRPRRHRGILCPRGPPHPIRTPSPSRPRAKDPHPLPLPLLSNQISDLEPPIQRASVPSASNPNQPPLPPGARTATESTRPPALCHLATHTPTPSPHPIFRFNDIAGLRSESLQFQRDAGSPGLPHWRPGHPNPTGRP
jgi:hypothetical protein